MWLFDMHCLRDSELAARGLVVTSSLSNAPANQRPQTRFVCVGRSGPFTGPKTARRAPNHEQMSHQSRKYVSQGSYVLILSYLQLRCKYAMKRGCL